MLAESLRDLRHTWPQLIAADLAARALAVTLLIPAVGLLLKAFLATTPIGVVTDTAILDFLLHPTGLAALVVAGGSLRCLSCLSSASCLS